LPAKRYTKHAQTNSSLTQRNKHNVITYQSYKHNQQNKEMKMFITLTMNKRMRLTRGCGWHEDAV